MRPSGAGSQLSDAGTASDDLGTTTFFYEQLPAALDRLLEDTSPQAQVRASVTYNHIVEGMLALTGYHAWNLVCKSRDIMPGMQEIVKRIGDDERRHMAWGTFTCRRHVAADDANFGVVEQRIEELLQPALEMVEYPFAQFPEDDFPFGVDKDEMTTYAYQRGTRRLGTIESARGKDLSAIEGDYEPIHLVDRFATEDAAAYADAG